MFKLNTWFVHREYETGTRWYALAEINGIIHTIEYSVYSNTDTFRYRRLKKDGTNWDLVKKYKGTTPYIDREAKKIIIKEIFHG